MTAVPTPLSPRAVYTSEPTYRWTVDQYHKMIQDGTLTEDDPVELIEGVLVFKMPKNSPHSTAVRRCRRSIEAVLPDNLFYDAENPVALADGEPEPDGIILSGNIDDYADAHPVPTQIALIIEVANSTLDRDRGTKLHSYARAGIACYWIVNLNDLQIEVYERPIRLSDAPAYEKMSVYKPGDSVPLQLHDRTCALIPVADILPGK